VLHSFRSYPARSTPTAAISLILLSYGDKHEHVLRTPNSYIPATWIKPVALYHSNMPHSDHSLSPSRDNFPDLPSFSDNVPTAPLLRISLEKLLNNDSEEQDRCWKACCDLGFFYLDLRTSSDQLIDGSTLLRDTDGLFEVMKEFYDLDVQEKVKYDFKDQGSYFGYKGYGEGFVDKQGTRDRNEFYNVRPFGNFLVDAC
jgi:hypothetical protein